MRSSLRRRCFPRKNRAMKRSLFSNKAIKKLSIFAIAVGLVSCQQSPSYSEFMKRDQKYYAQVAAACDTFLSKHPGGATPSVLIPDDNPGDDFMSPILRDLNSGRIETSSNFLGETNSVSRMLIMVGVSWGKLAKGGFEIIWANSREDSSLWNLTTHTEGLPDKVMFSLRKTTVSNGEKPVANPGSNPSS
jgi:hypothetical protein